jgi:hypothetical protein
VLLAALQMPAAPDIYVNSCVDETTLEINAFESLVGAHGGLGGWQDRGLLVAPTHLLDPDVQEICGAEELHRHLVAMLVKLGQRGSLTPTAPAPTMTDVTPPSTGLLIPDEGRKP